MKKIKADFNYYKENSLSGSKFAVMINPCFLSMLLYRLSNFLYRKKMKVLAKFIWFINRIIFSCDIDYRANISERVMLIHGIGVVIGCEAIIKSDVKIYQGVTIGGNNGHKAMYGDREISQPVIESGCIISPNSMIFGPVIIKENTFIKAGSIVSK